MAKQNDYSVIYSDEDIVVLNKRSGLLIAADRYNPDEPRLDLLAEEEFGKLYAVHRIDKDTSGIIVYARNADSQRNISMQFEQRLVQKTYHALVYGRPLWNELSVKLPLLPDGDAKHRTVVDKKKGKFSVTEFRLIGNCGSFSWIEAKPITGRTHQIRVHMKYIGYPLVGDPVYGVRKVVGDNGQFLHAKKLEFYHPRTNEFLSFETELPNDFNELLKELRSK